jgi:hypothetical protein
LPQNDYVNRLAIHTLQDRPRLRTLLATFKACSCHFLATRSAYSLKPGTSRTIPLQTTTTITRCSAALGTFLVKMIYDAGVSHRQPSKS